MHTPQLCTTPDPTGVKILLVRVYRVRVGVRIRVRVRVRVKVRVRVRVKVGVRVSVSVSVRVTVRATLTYHRASILPSLGKGFLCGGCG